MTDEDAAELERIIFAVEVTLDKRLNPRDRGALWRNLHDELNGVWERNRERAFTDGVEYARRGTGP